MKCKHCGKECENVITKDGETFCCDECYKKYEKGHEPKICKFC